jgi:hypothetical protein
MSSLGDRGIYVLNYTGGTSVQNRFGTEILMEDILPGEIATVQYIAGTQRLVSLKESEDAWENTTVVKWNIDYDKNIMQIGGENYTFDDSLIVISDNRQIDVHELNTVDTLIVKGIDNKVCSINVRTGHGYIKVTNALDLVDGLIEVGTNIMTVISEDMIIVAPEGTYTLTASKSGLGGSMEVEVKKNEETTVSLAGFQGEVEREGSVKFNIQPANVQYNVFIDGTAVDVSQAVSLSYGKHELVITSDQYTDYSESLVITSIYMNKTIDLSQSDSDSDSETETTTASEEETTTSSGTDGTDEGTTASDEREDGVETTKAGTNNDYVVISGPAGAEIYMDGLYLGTAPLSFAKSAGSHIFVLRQDGYETTAYSYTFDSGTEDVYIKFPDMVESDS